MRWRRNGSEGVAPCHDVRGAGAARAAAWVLGVVLVGAFTQWLVIRAPFGRGLYEQRFSGFPLTHMPLLLVLRRVLECSAGAAVGLWGAAWTVSLDRRSIVLALASVVAISIASSVAVVGWMSGWLLLPSAFAAAFGLAVYGQEMLFLDRARSERLGWLAGMALLVYNTPYQSGTGRGSTERFPIWSGSVAMDAILAATLLGWLWIGDLRSRKPARGEPNAIGGLVVGAASVLGAVFTLGALWHVQVVPISWITEVMGQSLLTSFVGGLVGWSVGTFLAPGGLPERLRWIPVILVGAYLLTRRLGPMHWLAVRMNAGLLGPPVALWIGPERWLLALLPAAGVGLVAVLSVGLAMWPALAVAEFGGWGASILLLKTGRVPQPSQQPSVGTAADALVVLIEVLLLVGILLAAAWRPASPRIPPAGGPATASDVEVLEG